jgi:CRP-like cAMP-binding protein
LEDKYPVEVMRVQLRQYFGERALLTGDVRAASVFATTKSVAVKIMKHDFLTLLAPLKVKRN